jgi:hypothetical protein
MIKKFVTVAAIATASLSFVATAQAGDFPATPMSSGPAMVTGMGPVGDVANLALMPVNALTQPFVGAPAPAPMAAPMMRRHHRHHMKHMMKKM